MKIQRKTLEILAKFIAERVTKEEILTLLNSYGHNKKPGYGENWQLLYEVFFQLSSSSKPSNQQKLLTIIEDLFHPSLFKRDRKSLAQYLKEFNGYLKSDNLELAVIFDRIEFIPNHVYDFKKDGYYEIGGINISADGTVIINDIRHKYNPKGSHFKIIKMLIVGSEKKMEENGVYVITQDDLTRATGIKDWEVLKKRVRQIRTNHKINVYKRNKLDDIFIPEDREITFNPNFKSN
ncbi:MAG: hypothetical protein M1366_00915 [Patescibacteria group bacterium]|nr:hypothetical protein [Patescibacteria group bacterium]